MKIGDKVKITNLPSSWPEEDKEYFQTKEGTIIGSGQPFFDFVVDVIPPDNSFNYTCWFEDELELV